MNLSLREHRFTPSGALVAELPAALSARDAYIRLAGRPHAIFFDSASAGLPAAATTAPPLDRFSFVAADPIHSLVVPAETEPHLARTRVAAAFADAGRLLTDLHSPTIPALPPFQGGLAGLVSFDAGLAHLGIGAHPIRSDGLPLVSLHVYDVVFAFDHHARRGWAISQGLPGGGPTARRVRAAARLEPLLSAVLTNAPSHQSGPASAGDGRVSTGCMPPGNVPLPGWQGVWSTHSRDDHLAMVRAGIELVAAGDIFQVNLAQRLTVPTAIDPVDLCLRSRAANPAPFAAAFDAGSGQIVSMSPERFLQVRHGRVRMHPIKGTRRMLASPEADLYAGDDLGDSVKDRAENVMIVDLVRNDLSRICRPESVVVESLCRLERFRYVQHLVSVVAGRLRPDCGPLDALLAAIPGGSVTGAPKHRACEIITALERTARGSYCGSLGFIGVDGTADFNLLIRSFVTSSDQITFSVGGGITAGSDPAAEYAETLHKAEGMLRVLESFGVVGPTADGNQ
jgi:para-aminobenzoate synthetase component 1